MKGYEILNHLIMVLWYLLFEEICDNVISYNFLCWLANKQTYLDPFINKTFIQLASGCLCETRI